MLVRQVFALLCLLAMGNAFLELHDMETQIIHEWNRLQYAISANDEKELIQDGDLIPENLQLGGIAAYKGRLYLTIPRMISSEGIPFVLGTLLTSNYDKTTQRIRPYPDANGQRAGKCTDLQNPLALDFDHIRGSLYVLDTGRTGVLSDTPNNKCPAKIVVYGRRTNMYGLDDTVVDQTQSVLTSFVLDRVTPGDEDVKYAYITDAGLNRLIVYDFVNQETWSFQDESFAMYDHDEVDINGNIYKVRYGFNSLAMSPDFNYLYFTSTGSRNLFQVPTEVLRKPGDDISDQVRLVGKKTSNSDGLFHGKDSLYYSALEEDAIYRWAIRSDMKDQNTTEGQVAMTTLKPVVQNFETMQWTDALTIDDTGKLFFTTNKAHLYYSGKIDFNDTDTVHFRVLTTPLGDYSYLDQRTPDYDV